MSSVNDVMKIAFFGPKTPEELDALDLSALKSFEQRGNGWSVTLFDRGGDGCEPQSARGDALLEAIERSAARLSGVADEPDKADLTVSGLSNEAEIRPPAGICPPSADKQDAKKWAARSVERDS